MMTETAEQPKIEGRRTKKGARMWFVLIRGSARGPFTHWQQAFDYLARKYPVAAQN